MSFASQGGCNVRGFVTSTNDVDMDRGLGNYIETVLGRRLGARGCLGRSRPWQGGGLFPSPLAERHHMCSESMRTHTAPIVQLRASSSCSNYEFTASHSQP